ncbi:YdcF family protein [Subtercola sp. YIM 133946]|uniref:YdcF family protein n=1 Tax=Subtercola sp. YIM 133946 TaxID=3118909 RepID=UPI002F941BF9
MALIVSVFTVALTVVTVKAFRFPDVDKPMKTDVIFVLGPATPSRIALAEKLIHQGLSDNLMISLPDTGKVNAESLPLCYQPHFYTVYCARADPFTTQGEARYLRDLSAEHGWTSATIITFTPHVTRARLILQRCFNGSLSVESDNSTLSPLEWLYEFAYQTGAMAKALASPGC